MERSKDQSDRSQEKNTEQREDAVNAEPVTPVTQRLKEVRKGVIDWSRILSC